MKDFKGKTSKIFETFSVILYKNTNDMFFIFGAIFFAISIPLLIYIALNPAFFNLGEVINPALAEQYGSLIGGLLGTLIGVSTTFFLLFTIFSQVKTNRKNQIESAFYKLVDYHKDNVEKLAIYGDKFRVLGSEVFVVLNKKFDFIYTLVKSKSGIVDETKLIDISYKILFYGFEDDNLTVLREKIEHHFDKEKFNEFIKIINFNTPNISYKGNSINIKESNEHQLGHYFRNIYNTFMIIDKDDTLTDNEKKFYIKILRTQLSTPEVWLLLLNSLSEMGETWERHKLITKYNVIKNIPKNYSKHFDFEKYYPKIDYEYKEIN